MTILFMMLFGYSIDIKYWPKSARPSCQMWYTYYSKPCSRGWMFNMFNTTFMFKHPGYMKGHI